MSRRQRTQIAIILRQLAQGLLDKAEVYHAINETYIGE